MTRDLLSVDTEYLESFLKKHCRPRSYGHELLARFYVSRERFLDAAKLQLSLALQPYIFFFYIFFLTYFYLFFSDANLMFESRLVFLQSAGGSARKAQSSISVSSAEATRKEEAEKLVEEIESLLQVLLLLEFFVYQ